MENKTPDCNKTNETPKMGDIYKHFKNNVNLYQVIAVASYIRSAVGSLTQNSLLFDSQTMNDYSPTESLENPNVLKNGKKMVVYLSLTTNETYVRDLAEWNDKVLYNGVITPRFVKHEKGEKDEKSEKSEKSEKN